MENQDKKRTNEPYEKPVLRKIDLIAEEVLAVGCKSQVSGSAPRGTPCMVSNCSKRGS